MSRTRRALVPALTTAVGLAMTAGLTAPVQAAGGPTGGVITIRSGVSLSGYDVATTSDGTAYVGWIGDDSGDASLRQVHLCVLKPGASGCTGGVQTASALGPSSAQDLKVVVTGGHVELVWIAQVGPSSGEFAAVFGEATVTGNALGASATIPNAPTYGTLTSAIPGKNGAVTVAVLGNSTLDNHVYYYPTLTSSPKSFTRPYFVGNAQVADNGKQTVLTTSQYGSLSGKVTVASKPSNSTQWKSFSTVAQSYTLGGVERLQTAGGHIRLVGASTKALYTPYVWNWNGKSFGKPATTGDHNEISSIDTTTDGSGRLATVDSEVGGLAVSNFAKGDRPARFRLKVKDTYAGGSAQIATSPSGRGWVIYSIEKQGTPAQILKAQAIKLPAQTRTVTKKSKAGTVRLTGPVSCLPVSSVKVSVKAKAAHGWHVARKSIRLGSHAVHGSVNGATLKPSTTYTLRGNAVFAKGTARKSVTATLSFKTCGRP